MAVHDYPLPLTIGQHYIRLQQYLIIQQPFLQRIQIHLTDLELFPNIFHLYQSMKIVDNLKQFLPINVFFYS